MEKVSVVIPVYNGWDFLKKNIDGLLKYDRDNIAEIIVVDDCSSTENIYEFDKELVTIIRNEKNEQFTRSVNKGLKRSSSEIVICLDADAHPIEPFVQKVVSMFNSDPLIGCIGFRTVDDEGKETGSHEYEPSVFDFVIGQRLERKFKPLRLRIKKNMLVYACSLSFKKQCLKEIDYFDEQTFPNFDCDIDISMRINRSKWKVLFSNEVTVCHEGGSSYKINYKRVIMSHESRWRLLRKHKIVTSPFVVKSLLKLRIRVEIQLFKLLALSKGPVDYLEKAKGRKILLERVNSFL